MPLPSPTTARGSARPTNTRLMDTPAGTLAGMSHDEFVAYVYQHIVAAAQQLALPE